MTLLVIWLGARQVMDGALSAGMLIAFSAYKDQFNSRVSGLIDKLVDVVMLRLHGERLSDIVLEAAEPQSPPLPEADAGPVPRLEVRQLRFRYNAYEPWVLDGVSLVIEPGESLAIVGPSGCGKSTLLNVMLGILVPVEGQVLLDGEPIDARSVSRLRRSAPRCCRTTCCSPARSPTTSASSPPTPTRPGSNSVHAWPPCMTTSRACSMAYNTLVGDMGAVLSGGQKQRILLARALYRRPKLLFLDEATSHLDIQREAAVNQALEALHITRVIVAHRPDTIRSAQRVVALLDGRLTSAS